MPGKKQKTEKTNVMRLLEQKGAAYTVHSYGGAVAVSGAESAALLGVDPARMFKPLVTQSSGGAHYVFLVPAARELDLRKAARAVGEKSIAMIPARELLPLTGYVHGGCSPIGMQKPFPTVVDASAAAFETILFSAGRIGYQVETSLTELKKLVDLTLADIST